MQNLIQAGPSLDEPHVDTPVVNKYACVYSQGCTFYSQGRLLKSLTNYLLRTENSIGTKRLHNLAWLPHTVSVQSPHNRTNKRKILK